MHREYKDTSALTARIVSALDRAHRRMPVFPRSISGSVAASGVLFLLSGGCRRRDPGGPCVILNKRSQEVRQAGDLCFPGGSITRGVDHYLSRLIRLPLSPLRRWPHWTRWQRENPVAVRRLSLVLATGLRESLEEMRLNPFGVAFLGPLPAQNLVMFHRVIYPMVCWIRRQHRFHPNWEVERIVRIPLGELLRPVNYGCYRLETRGGREPAQDFPCFLHHSWEGTDILWGATYRIVTVFLDLVFDFRPPPRHTLPVVHGALSDGYFHSRL